MKLLIRFLIVIVLWVYANAVSAQCSMCRAVPTSNHNHGGHVADGLNTGIVYLLIIPYIIISGLIIYFFREQLLAKWKSFRKAA
jgi:hypothetical protein